MGYPVYNPPVHTSVLFECGQSESSQDQGEVNPVVKQRYAVAIKQPLLYGIAVSGNSRLGLPWPGQTQYQREYSRLKTSDDIAPIQDCRKCHGSSSTSAINNAPFYPSGSFSGLHGNQTCGGYGRGLKYKLRDETPVPFLDQKIRGCHYHPDQPVGTMTHEEMTRCYNGLTGPEKFSGQGSGNTFIPNYRSKEWVERPMHELANEEQANQLTCRLPETKTEHYQFYHQVRMHRPTPKLVGDKFVPCHAIPMPGDL